MLKYCYISDSEEVYKVMTIIEDRRGSEEYLLIPFDHNNSTGSNNKTSSQVAVKKELVIPITNIDELLNPPSDLIKLIQVDRPGILSTLKTRFIHDSIYTSIGPILVALNPFKWIPGIYDEIVKEDYKIKKRNLSDHPHVFAIAHDAFTDLSLGKNQSLIISGESGAGKTEATKQCLNHLAYIAGSSNGIQSKILKASPILEAWGNAKTLRNNNSSRFGKFIEIWFNRDDLISGASNTTYILEKSRVVYQEKNERNYHVFYQLLKGSDVDLIREFRLNNIADNPSLCEYINQSGCISIEDVDDAQDYKESYQAFLDLGFLENEVKILYQIIAGILHIGNVFFSINPSNSEESIITTDSELWLENGCSMFGVDHILMKQALLYKSISGGGKRTSFVYAPYLPTVAKENKNAMVKEIYSRCFDWIVSKINSLMLLQSNEVSKMIGILDIFGFEIFAKNSFEQLCINLANEALQRHFNYNIFQSEMNLYMAEDVPMPKLNYSDNQDVLDFIIKKPRGIIPMLDEEGLVPKGSWEGFISKLYKTHSGNNRFKMKPGAKDFGIIHYAGEVYYDPSLFLIKNKDTLHRDVIDLLSKSSVTFLNGLFNESTIVGKGVGERSGSKITVGKNFSIQLESLINNLNSTKPRYIRCIKPNQLKKPNLFSPVLTNEQLNYSGIFDAVIIMQNGYPFRYLHSDFQAHYYMLIKNSRSLLLEKIGKNGLLTRDNCKLFVELVIKDTGIDPLLLKYFVGLSKIFFQAPQHKLLSDTRDRITIEALKFLQPQIRRYLVQNILGKIKKLENNCMKAVQDRNIENLDKSANSIDLLVLRMNKVINFVFYSDIVTIAVKLSNALVLEQNITNMMSEILDSNAEMTEKFKKLEKYLSDVKSINYSVKYKDKLIDVRYEDNRKLCECLKETEKIGIIIKMEKSFISGLEERNEILLEQTLVDLNSLIQSNMVPGDFCTEEKKKAETFINESRKFMKRLISDIMLAIQNGKFSIMSGNSIDSNLDYSVNAKPLSEILVSYSVKDGSILHFKVTRKVELLLELVRRLRNLRTLIEEALWEDVWISLQNNWLDTENELAVFSNELQSLILVEIKDISLGTIYNFTVPKLLKEVSKNKVPESMFYFHYQSATPMIDTSDLGLQLEKAKQYQEYFDQNIEFFVNTCNERLQVRNLISVGNLNNIVESISNLKYIDQEDADVVNMKSYEKLLLTRDRLFDCLLNDNISGNLGSLNFEAINTDSLIDLLENAVALDVHGDDWNVIIALAQLVLDLRVSLAKFDDGYDHALNLIDLISTFDLKSKNTKTDNDIEYVFYKILQSIEIYRREILHLKEIEKLLNVIEQTAVKGEVGEIDMRNLSYLNIFSLIEDSHLIKDEETMYFLNDVTVLLNCRKLLYKNDLNELETNIINHRKTSKRFKNSKILIKQEFILILNEVYDQKARNLLKSCLCYNFDLSLKDTKLMSELINKNNEIVSSIEGKYELSHLTLDHLRSVKISTMICHSIINNKWESDKYFLFGHWSLEDLPILIKEFLRKNKSFDSIIENTIKSVSLLDEINNSKKLNSLIEDILNKSESTDQVITVSELLFYVKSSSLSIYCIDFYNAIDKLWTDRLCRSLLILVASVNKLSGNIDYLQLLNTTTINLDRSVKFVKRVAESAKLSETTIHYLKLTDELLYLRKQIIESENGRKQINNTLYIGILKKILNNNIDIVQSFPMDEFQLVYDRLNDCQSIEEITKSLDHGRAQFINGKFNVSIIEYSHVERVINSASKNKKRSIQLDKLLTYSKLIVKLRYALSNNKWDLSISAESKNPVSKSETINDYTVKQIVQEFNKTLKIFNHTPNTIPQQICNELNSVGNEWERKVIISRFSKAFKRGMINGNPLSLFISNCYNNNLMNTINEVAQLEVITGEKDNDIQLLVESAKQMIDIRNKATDINNGYKPSQSFSQPTNNIMVIIKEKLFIEHSIESAITNVDSVTKSCHRMFGEFAEIEKILMRKINLSTEMQFNSDELNLLFNEISERKFIGKICNYFRELKSLLFDSKNESKNDYFLCIIGTINEYNTFRDTLDIKDKSSRYQSPLFRYIYNNAIVLNYLFKSYLKCLFDDFQRDWRIDVINVKTPRIDTLVMNYQFDVSYSIQQLIRSINNFPLHPNISSFVLILSNQIDDNVSVKEMNIAISNPLYQVTGAIGQLTVSESSLNYMESIIKRIHNVGIHNNCNVSEIYCTFNVLYQFRKLIKNKEYLNCVEVIQNAYSCRENNLEMLMKVVVSDRTNLLTSAIKEVKIICCEVFHYMWKLQATKLLCDGVLSGSRGAMVVSSLNWNSLNEIIDSYKLLIVVSADCADLYNLVVSVRNLRREIGLSYVDIETVLKNPVYGNEIDYDSIFSLTASKINFISFYNTYGACKDSMNSVTNLNNLVGELLNEKFSDRLEYIDTIKSLLMENKLIKTHNKLMVLVQDLIHLLSMNILNFHENGMEVNTSCHYDFLTFLKAVKTQDLRPEIIQEKGWILFIDVAFSIDHLFIKLEELNYNTTTYFLQPGSKQFSSMTEYFYKILRAIEVLKKNVIHLKSDQPTATIFHLDKTIRKALYEHSRIISLDSIIHAHDIIINNVEDWSLMKISIRELNVISIADLMLDNKSVEMVGEVLLTYCKSLQMETMAGKLFIDYMMKLIELRLSIKNKKWYEAKLLVETMHRVDSLPRDNLDIENVQKYLEIITIRRYLEQGIFSIVIPNKLGWSLSNTSAVYINNISDETFMQTVMEVRENYNLKDYSNLFHPILLVGNKIAELSSSVKIGAWISIDDNKIDQKDSVNSISELIRVPALFDVAITLNVKTIDGVRKNMQNTKSVYVCLQELKSTIKNNPALEPCFVKYINNLIRDVGDEIKILQLEYLSRSTFARNVISGEPGEIIISNKDILSELKTVVEAFDKIDHYIMNNCISIKNNYYSIKMFYNILKAHFNGDIISYSKYMDLIIHIQELSVNNSPIDVFTGEIISTVPFFDKYDLLKYDDEGFVNIYRSKVVKQDSFARYKYLKPTAALRTLLKSNVAERAHTGADCNKLENEGFISRDEEQLKKVFKANFGSLIFENIQLVDELLQIYNLLKSNYLFEVSYHLFHKGIKCTPSDGIPGELITKDIDYKLLEKSLSLLKEFSFYSSQIKLLVDSNDSLILIRKGQNSNINELISCGIELSKDIINFDRNNPINLNVSYFSGIQKRYLSLAVKEIDIASLDLQQRTLIDNAKTALQSPGIVLTEYPYDFSSVDIKLLEDVYQMSKLVAPSCNESITLLFTVEIILNLRKFVIIQDWFGMKDYYDDIKLSTFITSFNPKSLQEFEDCDHIVKISCAAKLSLYSYKNGFVDLLPGVNDNLDSIRYDSLEEALQIYDSLPPDWLVGEIQIHHQTSIILYKIRKWIIEENYEDSYNEILGVINSFEDDNINKDCKSEIQVAYDYSAYNLCCSKLCSAILDNEIQGTVSNLVFNHISINSLASAITYSKNVEFYHHDIECLQESAEVMFYIGKALLLNHWFPDDMELLNYSNSLGKYFFNQHEAIYSSLLDQNLGATKIFTTEYYGIVTSEIQATSNIKNIIACIDNIPSKESRFLPEVINQIDLLRKECLYREIILLIIKNIHSHGPTGVPGMLDISKIATRSLEKAIDYADENSDISHIGLCHWLLRDATVLLRIREYRLLEDWANLQNIISLADNYKVDSDINYIDWDKLSPNNPSIIPTVFEEICLIQADTLFHISLCEFTNELLKEELIFNISNSDQVDQLHRERISIVMELVEFTKKSLKVFSSNEFSRLLEAQELLLELRIFYYNESSKSPQDIISKIAFIKKRDRANNQVCYTTMLIYEINKMETVLDFPYNLNIIQKELVNGQKYIQSPVGCINLSDVNNEILMSAYRAALPSLEIMGNDEHDALMKLAFAVIEMRKMLITGDLRAVMNVILKYETILNSSDIISAEVTRLRVELENQDCCKLIELGLRNGRYVDVLSIAKMISQFDVNQKSIEPNDNHKVITTRSSISSARRSTEVFLSNVTSSLNILSRSIAVANKISQKSDDTHFYINIANFILSLRENIINCKWNAVRQQANSDIDLPNVAIEELKAIKEGMIYKDCVISVANALRKDCISGFAHKININKINVTLLDIVIENSNNYDDFSINVLNMTARKIKTIRKLFKDSISLTNKRGLTLITKIWKNIHKENDLLPYLNTPVITSSTINVKKKKNKSEDSSSASLEESIDEFNEYKTNFEKIRTLYAVAGSDFKELKENENQNWTRIVWNGICSACNEVSLIKECIRFSKVYSIMASSLELVPDCVKFYLDNKILMKDDENFDMSTVCSIISDYSDSNKHEGNVPLMENYYLEMLKKSINISEDYLVLIPDPERCEEMMLVLEMMKSIFAFRLTLSLQTDSNLLIELINECKEKINKGYLSIEYGRLELNTYIEITDRFLEIKDGLSKALLNNQISGYIDSLDVNSIECYFLQSWVNIASNFLRISQGLCIGLKKLVEQSEAIINLRTAAKSLSWSLIESLIEKYKGIDWIEGKSEYEFIVYATRFQKFHTKMVVAVKEFDSKMNYLDDYYNIELQADNFNNLFHEISVLLEFSSSRLESKDLVSKSFFTDNYLVASLGLHKVLNALHRRNWFNKKLIYNCEHQKVVSKIDTFIYEFFSLSDSDYVDNKSNIISDSYDIEDILKYKKTSKSENLFSILISCDWSIYPFNVRNFFDRIRNTLIDKYIYKDLDYFCKRGRVVLDPHTGNLVISEMILNYLKLTMNEVDKVKHISDKLGILFEWSDITLQYIDCSRVVLSCRGAILDGELIELKDILRNQGFLLNKYEFDKKLNNIRLTNIIVFDEMKDIEMYVIGRTSVQVVADIIMKLNDESFHHDQIDNIEYYQELFDIADVLSAVMYPIEYLKQVTYLVTSYIDCIKAAISGVYRHLKLKLKAFKSQSTISVFSPFFTKYEFCGSLRALVNVCLSLSKESSDFKQSAMKDSETNFIPHILSELDLNEEASIKTIDTHKISLKSNISHTHLKEANVDKYCLLLTHKIIDILISISDASKLKSKTVSFKDYKTISSLHEDVDNRYLLLEPLWSLSVIIVLHYLREEIKDKFIVRKSNQLNDLSINDNNGDVETKTSSTLRDEYSGVIKGSTELFAFLELLQLKNCKNEYSELINNYNKNGIADISYDFVFGKPKIIHIIQTLKSISLNVGKYNTRRTHMNNYFHNISKSYVVNNITPVIVDPLEEYINTINNSYPSGCSFIRDVITNMFSLCQKFDITLEKFNDVITKTFRYSKLLLQAVSSSN